MNATTSTREMVLRGDTPPAYDINFESIPEGLTRLNQWVTWRWELLGGKWTKVPCDASGRKVSGTDARLWNDFATAVSISQRCDYGIGFAFAAAGDLVGIDLDDCRDPATHEIKPWALYLIQTADTYSEVSPSGTGVKLFLRGQLPDKFSTKHERPSGEGEVEIYRSGRFFTVTGNRVPGTPDDIQERCDQLNRIYGDVSDWKMTKPRTVSGVQNPPRDGCLSDDRDTALAALSAISNAPGVDYESWLNVGMALHSVDAGMCADWVAWSSQSPKHVDGECERKWASFTAGGGITIGTLCHMADQDSANWRDSLRRHSPSVPQNELTDPIAHDTDHGTLRQDETTQTATKALHAALKQLAEGRSVDHVMGLVQSKLNSVTAKPFTLNMVDSRTFAAADYRQAFLCRKILAANQPMMIGGPSKCLKTSLALDLAISLSTGTPFLGQFHVPDAVNVGVISGESGLYTLQRNAATIAQSRGIDLRDAQCYWGDTLPQISRPSHLAALGDMISQLSLKVAFLDPCYLMLLSGDSQGRSASNLFDVGSILLGLTELGQSTGCTLILLHHNRKNMTDPFAMPELGDMAFSGFSEWARQWLLVNRRERYEQGTGIHRLWMNAGGSAGHNSVWSIDIDEGVLDDNLEGRRWEVSVATAGDARREEQAAKESKKKLAEESKVTSASLDVLNALRAVPGGLTQSGIRTSTAHKPDVIKRAIDQLLKSESIEQCQIVSQNKQRYSGYRAI